MRLIDDQFSEQALRRLGVEAAALLYSADFERLAHRFGYALAYDREPAAALKEDVSALFDLTSAHSDVPLRSVDVTFLERNDIGLLATVSVQAAFGAHAYVLLELVVASDGQGGKRLFLEQVSYRAEGEQGTE